MRPREMLAVLIVVAIGLLILQFTHTTGGMGPLNGHILRHLHR